METREEGISVAKGILTVSTPTTLGLAHTGRLQHCCPYAPSTGMQQMVNSVSGFPSNITRSYQLRTYINSVLLGSTPTPRTQQYNRGRCRMCLVRRAIESSI
jgi:hypothetical protein